ncbi:hypothetical protein T4B_14300 [Trichinella pseudospiralis]|uniref:Uncharacterized protein n=1 Tax=Trichinella pseudospiralis TaxID=6337 RepID=A0A0V1JC14_TRIPS|nr:hypothetical protein T4B_14300 [Trichinella pseudospiralis]
MKHCMHCIDCIANLVYDCLGFATSFAESCFTLLRGTYASQLLAEAMLTAHKNHHLSKVQYIFTVHNYSKHCLRNGQVKIACNGSNLTFSARFMRKQLDSKSSVTSKGIGLFDTLEGAHVFFWYPFSAAISLLLEKLFLSKFKLRNQFY